jgi:uncharacterized protein
MPENRPAMRSIATAGSVTRVGLISDTHGLLRPQVTEALRSCEHIIHAGDIGKPEILDALAGLAPVTAVRGNNDRGPWAEEIPEERLIHIGGVEILVLHDLAQLAIDPAGRGIRVVISGHSHKPVVREAESVLYVNPGSAGPRRFRLPVTVAELVVDRRTVTARIVPLDVSPQ